MLPILLSVGGWVWSRWYDLEAMYAYKDHAVDCGLDSGCVSMAWGHFPRRAGWYCYVRTHDLHFWLPEYLLSHSFLGFGGEHVVDRRRGSGFDVYSVYVPIWFLILLSAAVLFLVWRKTRPKIDQLRAFPVQVEAKGG